MDTGAEAWRILDVRFGNRHDFTDAIDDDAGLDTTHLHDDDAAVFAAVVIHAELGSEVRDRNDLAAQIDDATHEFRHAGHARDRLHADDLVHFQNLETILFVGEKEGEVLARSGRRGVGGDRLRLRAHGSLERKRGYQGRMARLLCSIGAPSSELDSNTRRNGLDDAGPGSDYRPIMRLADDPDAPAMARGFAPVRPSRLRRG